MITQCKGVAVNGDSLVLWLKLSQQLNGWWWTGNKFPKHVSHAIYCKCGHHVSSLVQKVVDILKECGRRAASVCCLDLLIVNLLVLFLLLLRPIYENFTGRWAFCFIYLFIFKVTPTMTQLKKKTSLFLYVLYLYCNTVHACLIKNCCIYQLMPWVWAAPSFFAWEIQTPWKTKSKHGQCSLWNTECFRLMDHCAAACLLWWEWAGWCFCW